MHYVFVLMVGATVVILVCVVIVATGRGGEMAIFPIDYAPPDFTALAATDVALLRPPTTLWGYNMQATDEALNGIASALSARDVRIAILERQVADLLSASRAGVADNGARAGQNTVSAPRDERGDYSAEDTGWPNPAAGSDASAPRWVGWPEDAKRDVPVTRSQPDEEESW